MCLTRILTALDRHFASLRTDRGYINRKYLLSDFDEYDESMTRVPEDAIYVEEWVKGDQIRRRILYEGEEITPYIGNAFDPVQIPWQWIGDVSTDVDVTQAVARYIAPGNVIRLDLIFRFIRVSNDMEIVYCDARTGRELLFPDSGVTIRNESV